MPIGPYGEIIGTTNCLDGVSENVLRQYKTKVNVPKNPKVITDDEPKHKLTPSVFMFQMSMDTEKKLQNTREMKRPPKVELLDMAETTHQKFSSIPIDEPLFQPFPSEIYFQRCEPFKTHEVPLILRNNDKVPRLVKVVQADSPYFKIVSPLNCGDKVGPGLPTVYKIQFTPEDRRDYKHELVCVTEREKFIVPVTAVGARALLDFPDDVNFATCPVKHSSSKTLLVRNVGEQEAKFTLNVNKPFAVRPSNGVLPVNESMQVTIEFTPSKTGDHHADLVLGYDTGETILVSLYGAAQDSNVRMDKSSLRIENTYIGMANQRVVTITNRTNVIAKFRWTEFATQESEDMQRTRFVGELKDAEGSETDRFLEECLFDPSLKDKMSIISRTFQNRRRNVADNHMLFSDDVVKIEPSEGEIWPNSTAEITVIFKPDCAETYTRTAFCDITGRESRIPLKVTGIGIGPKVQFSCDTLDMGNIFLGSTHLYEIVMANKGDIDAIYTLVPNTSTFGKCFMFNPSESIVMPAAHQAIQVAFSSQTLGNFEEEFEFQVDGAPEKVKIKFIGSVIGPTFHFDVNKIKFGTISYGFLNTFHCTLINTALVPMSFNLRVPGDGGVDNMSISEVETTHSEAGSLIPKEFEITPSRGTLMPQSDIKIEIDFCSTTLKKYECSLIVDVDGVGEEVLSIPIEARCIVPAVTVMTPIINYGRCFMRYPYERNVLLKNDTDLPARYEIIPQQIGTDTPILYSSSQRKGVIEPNSTKEVPLVIESQGLEELSVTAYFMIVGSHDAPLPVQLQCVGEGPVVHISPLSMNWGEIPVLTDITRVVKLSNESLVPAKFTAHMVRPGSVWKIEPQQGEIPPEETFEISLTANVDDVVRFQDKLQINFLESQARLIPVEAYGTGTTIVTEMTPYLVLGPHFSNSPCVKTYKITNKGRRLQQLVWTTDGFPLYKPKKNPLHDAKDMRFKGTSAMPDFRQPIFQLWPTRMELRPGESCDLTIQGMVNESQEIRERIHCHSIIGRQGGKELIMIVDLYAEFICPLLDFSHKSVFFRLDKEPSDNLEKRVQEVSLTNVSSLPLTVSLDLKHPFSMLIEEEPVNITTLTLDVGMSYQLRLQFNPFFKDDLHIRTADEVLSISYAEHPHIDYISVRGEVYFPNLAFEKTKIDFGCILNDTEVTRYINVTNNSPMNVNYYWSFLVDDEPRIIRRKRKIPRQTYTVLEDEDSQVPEPQIQETTEDQAEPTTSGDEAGPTVENVTTDVEDENAKDLEQEKDGQSVVEVQLDDTQGVLIHALQAMTAAPSAAPSGPPSQSLLPPFSEDQPSADGNLVETEKVQPFSRPVSDSELGGKVETEKEDGSKPIPEAEPTVNEGTIEEHIEVIPGHNGEPTDQLYYDELAESRPVTRMGPMKTPPAINSTIKALLEGDGRTDSPLGVEEVFDILPLYGILKPGETEQVTLTFYGHADIESSALALCHVEGGPTYEIDLVAESSLVEYRFDATEIDFQKAAYDQVTSAEITLVNKGRVGFEFEGVGMEPLAPNQKPQPGVPTLIPHKGYIEPLSEMVLTIKFLPGVPDRFHKTFKIQVAHFEPEEFTCFCDGVFPRITFDLPRYNDPEGNYSDLASQARQNLAALTQASAKADVLTVHEDFPDSLTAHQDVTPRAQFMDSSGPPCESDLQTEIERLTVQQFAETAPREHELEKSNRGSKSKRRRNKAILPDYLLDFGYVILGTVRTHVVRVANPGLFPVSFSVDHSILRSHGFNVELDKVKQLPGAPDHEPIDFVVSFDPRGANLPLGDVEAVVPINIINGPQVNIRLKANVTMPDMEVSSDVLEFGEAICGNCQIMTVQLHNHKHVRCEWSALPTEKELRMQSTLVDKHVPMHLRRKMKPEKPKPKSFELMPATGVLLPGQRVNIQVKFMPTEERNYEQRLTIRLAQSSQRIMMLCKGIGLEPRLEFDRNLVEFGPVLPHSTGDEQEIVVRNPCKFPIEFYSLECDKQYLEEEKILRLMKGWDEYNTILLPPRQVSGKLPEELTSFYEEQVKKVEQAEAARKEAAADAAAVEAVEEQSEERAEASTPAPPSKQATAVTSAGVGSRNSGQEKPQEPEDDEDKIRESLSSIAASDLEITPVSAAIARHLGIDLTPDGKAARNRRGVAIVVHGAPLSGKTTTAITLAKLYSAALLTIDGVVLEAISNGSTPAGLKAKELCAETAKRKAEEQKLIEAEEAEKKLSGGGLSMEAVQAHTAGQAVTNIHSNTQSLISNRKGGSLAAGGKDKHAKAGAAAHGVAASQVDNASTSQVPTSPPPLAAPIARRLSVSASVGGEEGLFSTVLPEELVVEILSDRLQLNDCHSGIIIDGLESLFCQNLFSAANCVLKAFNNRKYLYFVTLKYDYASMKEQEKREAEAKAEEALRAQEEEKRRLEEMDEDEYDALSDAQKAEIDRKRLEMKRERRKREQEEKVERERIEKEKQEAEQRRLDEEKAAKKRKNKDKDAKDDKGKDAKEAKPPAKGKAATTTSNDRVGNLKSSGGAKPHDGERPESHMTHASGDDSDKKKGGKGKGDKNRPISNENAGMPNEEVRPEKEHISEAERLLMQRFKTFEVSFKEICELVERWDRTIGAARPPVGQDHEEETHHATHPASGKKGRKERVDKHAAKHEATTDHKPDKEMAESEHAENDEGTGEQEGDGVGISALTVDISQHKLGGKEHKELIDVAKLPPMNEVLDGLGLGEKGPPIPPMALFSVIPYPVRRKAPTSEAASHYTFVASGPDDPNVQVDDKSKDDEDEKAATPDGKPEVVTPTGKRGKGDKSKQEKADKGDKGDDKKEKRKTSAGRGKPLVRRGSQIITTPPPGGAQTPGSEVDGQRLTSFRWTVPANGEILLRLRFSSEDLGQYDQTMNFELIGTRRRYQLYCRGVCSFPTISREPRVVFPSRVKTKKTDDILHKQYVLSSEVFEFGPLLAGQNRETMKANRFPEHNEKLTIHNTSPMEADISFCYLDDSKGDCFMLDPPHMSLKPGAQQELNIYAFPRSKEFYEDQLICCIKENPEPIIFKVSCHGCRPELEVDKKVLQFEKVLLHRKDTKTLYLRNTTLIPVGWRLSGMENLGEDFSVTIDSGIVEPRTEFALQAHFRASKPVITNRKSIRLEILDSDDQYGIVEAITIHVHAEAYDVALDMSFPKGTDGGIDFGTVRVGEEGKNQLTLKNKGKYEIAYSFILENPSGPLSLPDVASLFVVTPQKGTLTSTDRPSTVQISFKSSTEISIRDLPILRCQVIEPNVSDGGETIASIPVKLTVKSVFSKYTIAPKADINFGSLLVNFKKTRTFTIENNGTFDFKYTISRAVKEVRNAEAKSRPTLRNRDNNRDGSSSGRASAAQGGRPPRRTDSIRQDVGGAGTQATGGGGGQSRLQLGMFTIFPAFGIVLPNGHATITVDCAPESVGKCEEDITIDITERDPADHPGGIAYKLLAEACIPGICNTDIGSIFEEHRICKSLSFWQQTASVEVNSVFGEEENRFQFNNVIVGRRAKARFKLSNSQKVPCDLNLSIKPVTGKFNAKNVECFDIEPPTKLQIPAHSHVYATVLFAPGAMQHYNAIFEAAIEGVPQAQAKSRNLSFELCGDGNLPRITICRPNVRNKKGQPLLLFRKNLIGHSETLPLMISNEGCLNSKVYIDLLDNDGVFKLTPAANCRAFLTDGYEQEGGMRKPHTCSVLVNVGEIATFDVTYSPRDSTRTQASIQLSVEDNQYEDSIIQMIGEGYRDDITLDNLHSISRESLEPAMEDGNMADDDLAAAKSNLIKFGDSAINESKTLSFTMTNHSQMDCIRFSWPEHPSLKFSPTIGHIHAGMHKDMTVTFRTDRPVSMQEEPVLCNITRISFEKQDQVTDWDDRMRTVKWIDVPVPNARPAKKKVTEVEAEPIHTEIPDSARSVELLVTANSDFSKYKCKTDSLKFKDTLMFQTRVFEVPLHNKGNSRLDYSWQVVMEENIMPSRSVTFAAGEPGGSRADSITPSVIGEPVNLYQPFSIEPSFGSVPPGKKVDLKMKFSPLDLLEYEARLVCTIPNLEEGKQGPVLSVKGCSLLPYCHFELASSDYISSAKRNPEMRGPRGAPPGTTLDPNTRVIEFLNVGVGLKTIKRFSIINPTADNYSFQWINDDDPDPKNVPCFSCHTPKASIKTGKKQEVEFEFISRQLGITESFWQFIIPEQNISVPFLLVGEAIDPAVNFDRSHLNFKALLIGHEACETVYLRNDEKQPFPFSFEELSLFSAGQKDRLLVEPSSGVIDPGAQIAINLFFTPKTDREVNFNLSCNIRKKTEPIRLNVKAEGYCMNTMVVCEDSVGSRVELTPHGTNSINFGNVEINEESIRNITVFNSGKFNFDYMWELTERSSRGARSVTITPESGAINKEDSSTCVLTFMPTSRLALVGCELTLKISHGPTYNINVLGTGVAPGLHFSFLQHNFGPCFVYRDGMPTHSVILEVQNRDKKDISLDCLFEPTNYLHHDFEAKVLTPNQSEKFKFSFYPREAKKYRETVEFEINGLSRQKIEFLGMGTEMKVEVANTAHKITRLGVLRVGQTVRKSIPLVNNSPSPITFKLSCTPSRPELHSTKILKITPTGPITLEARGGTCKVDILFAPKTRIPQFCEEVLLEYAGMFQPVLVLQGCCQGMEIGLDTEAIAFGSVVQKSQSCRKVIMANTGDIGSRFKWDANKFLPDFSITPSSGYISPGMDVTFEVNFHPADINPDIRYENLRCHMEGVNPLRLTLTGMCTGVPAFKEIQHFTSHVRNKETKNLMVINRTNQLWQLKPIIDGECWSGPDWFVVEPQQSKAYELTYYPLTMSHEGKKHQGSIFFPLPDGNGLLYTLSGTATEPKVSSRTICEVPCKTHAVEMLPVQNWLKKPQRFRVKIEAMKPDKFDVGTTVKGLDYIDVPPNSKRDYKLNFYAHKEGVTMCKVTFINEQTGEYQWIEVGFKVARGGALDLIKLTTPVRQSTQYSLVVKNPLANPVTFTTSCTVNELAVPSQISVPAESEGVLTIEFMPLTTRVQAGKLELNHADLGVYLYELECSATPAGPEKALYFRCALGSHQVLPAKFLNFAKQKTEYICKLDNIVDFSSEKTINAAPASGGGTETSVDVTFEPSQIGELRTNLTISSQVGGDYAFPIFAVCTPPKPQGPFVIKSGSTTYITFRNYFSSTTAFTFTVDNAAFHVSKSGDNIRGKKEHRIVIGFDGSDSGTRAPVMGKLIVSCARSAGGNSPAQWVYYLKGVTPEAKEK